MAFATAVEATDHGASVLVLAFVGQQRFADVEDVALLAEQLGDHAVARGGDVHQGLGGLN